MIKNLKINKKRLLSLLAAAGFTINMGYTIVDAKGEDVISMPYTSESQNDFYFGYPTSSKKLKLFDEDKMENILKERGISLMSINKSGNYPINNVNSYQVRIDDKYYIYRPSMNTLYCDNFSIKFKLYSSSSDFSKIDNVITIIGGTHERSTGYDLKGVSLGENTLVIVCFTGDRDVNLVNDNNMIAASTRFVNYLVGEREIHNSIVGVSEGAQAAFISVANNNGLYQTFICSNGAAYYTTDGTNLIKRYAFDNYESFKNTELIFLESKNNNNWNYYIVETLLDLKNHGISMDNISFYTNDIDLINGRYSSKSSKYDKNYYPSIKSILGKNGKLYFVSDSEARRFGGWESHKDGYNMVVLSRILNYISSSEYRARYYENYKNKILSMK